MQAPVPFAPHSRPGAPITSQMLLRNPLPVIGSAPPPSEAFEQCSLHCFLLALSSSAKHQAPSHSFQQAFECTSSSLLQQKAIQEALLPTSLQFTSSQAQTSILYKPHAFTSLEGTPAPVLSGLQHLAVSFPQSLRGQCAF